MGMQLTVALHTFTVTVHANVLATDSYVFVHNMLKTHDYIFSEPKSQLWSVE